MIHWEFVDSSDVYKIVCWLICLLVTVRAVFAKDTEALRQAYMQCDYYEKQATVQRDQAKKYLEHIREVHENIEKLHALIKASVHLECMIRGGGRPIVTKAPEGMTLEEAQAMIDKIFLTVKSTENQEVQ